MKSTFYLPFSTNEFTGNFGQFTIDNPIIFYDILVYHAIYDSLFKYFPVINERVVIDVNGRDYETSRYIFMPGEKAFIPHVKALPTFSLQRVNLPTLNNDMHNGIIQIQKYKFYVKGNSEEQEDFYWGTSVPISIKYNLDVWSSSRTDLTTFGLFYLDLFSQKGFHLGRTTGLSLYNKITGSYEELPFYIKPSDSGVVEHLENDVDAGLGDYIYLATASFTVDAFYIKAENQESYKKLVVHWLFNYNNSNTLEVFDINGVDITNEYKTYWLDILKKYDLLKVTK